ncbi:MAG: hypothetical protein Q9191_003425 [Dirinaria sp. TL-2023a]
MSTIDHSSLTSDPSTYHEKGNSSDSETCNDTSTHQQHHENTLASPTKHRQESYVLKRNYAASTRLNCQLFLWKLELGYSLHPSIASAFQPTAKASYTPRIADLATGTALWAFDIARDFPAALIDCFDISLEQCPPAQWLSRNITVRRWDIFSNLDSEIEDRYDVVHIRLLLLVVRNNNPRPLLRNALKMLKPGGWLQWDELDPWNAHTVSAATEENRPQSQNAADKMGEKATTEFQKKQELTAMDTLRWVRELDSVIQEVGFEEVRREEIGCDHGLAKYFQDMQFLVMEEEASSKSTEREKETVMRAIEEGVVESQEGRARVTPKVVCLGRKPQG